jgi:hypothetical protein
VHVSDHAALEADFWRVFGRALGRPLTPGRYTPAQLPEWDSLRHVELVFELEEKFRIEVPPGAIADLFSDTDAVLAFLRAQVADGR